jgi:hypothetical protein
MSKTLSFSELSRQDQHEDVWVLNITQGERRGNVFFTVPNPTGTREDQVTVFNTFVPTNLTDQVTRKQLLDSSSFRRAVNHEMLRLIPDSEARRLLDEPGAKEEFSRIRQLSVGSATAEAQFGVGKETERAEVVAAGLDDGISNPVKQFTDLMDTMDDASALTTLRNLGTLKIEEYRHVLKRCKELRYANTGQRCSDEIKRLKDTNDD